MGARGSDRGPLRRLTLPGRDRCLHFERLLQSVRGGLSAGNPRFSSSGRHRPRGPQPDTIDLSCGFLQRGRLCVELQREAESKKTPFFEGVRGVNPKTESSRGGWGGTTCWGAISGRALLIQKMHPPRTHGKDTLTKPKL